MRTQVDLLQSAVARVVAGIPSTYPVLAGGQPIRVEKYLRSLQADLVQIMSGADPANLQDRVVAEPLVGPSIRALQRELIHEGVQDPEAAPAALALLRALASLEEALPLSDERLEPPRNLEAEMGGADAFELLVEVAHDFRSPLTSILFLAEALRDGHSGPVTDVQRSQLGLIYSAAFGLASIASDVMDLARRERDLIQNESEAFALTDLFAHVERMVRPIVEEKGLELRVVVPPRWQARGHRHAISRVLLNLTTNALKFTDAGFVEIGVLAKPHGRLEYYVQDTGRGITPEQRRRLFQPFKRRAGGGKAPKYFSGSGIGLSISRRLLHAMGSELSLDSSDERGSRFSFVLASSGRG